jgi:DNA polymerase III epsilon subunit family exonuclease
MRPGRDRRRERPRPFGDEARGGGSLRGEDPPAGLRGDDREDRDAGRIRGGGKGPPSLVQSAARRLEGGSVHTLELARDILGLSGHPGAAAAAVYSLLGPDPRFRVDAEGVWSLEAALRGVGPSLGFLDYAVVDVETTGGDPELGHRIIELAIVEIRDGVIARDFRTLVNPGRRIPPGVVQLTGITDGDVSVAPFFEDVAEQVAERLRGRVFVAQNAAFDRKFVAAQLLESTGDVPPAEILCTVRMARRFLPELRKRNLDALSRHFGIRIHGRHRAYGDALATARIFLRLLDEASGKGIHDLHRLVTFLGGNLGTDRSDPRPDPDDDLATG